MLILSAFLMFGNYFEILVSSESLFSSTALKTSALVNDFEIEPILYLVVWLGLVFDSTSEKPMDLV